MIKNNLRWIIPVFLALTAIAAQSSDKPSTDIAASTAAVRFQRQHPKTAVPASSENALSSVEVVEMAFTARISSMAPVGRGDSFDASIGTVYFWNRLKAGNPPIRIRHVWYHDGDKVGEYDITLRHANSRAWTHHHVDPGYWRVDILDENGNPVASAAFPVRPPSAQ